MDIIGGLLVGAGLVLVIDHPDKQWHYVLGAGIILLVIPRVMGYCTDFVRAFRTPK